MNKKIISEISIAIIVVLIFVGIFWKNNAFMPKSIDSNQKTFATSKKVTTLQKSDSCIKIGYTKRISHNGSLWKDLGIRDDSTAIQLANESGLNYHYDNNNRLIVIVQENTPFTIGWKMVKPNQLMTVAKIQPYK